MILAGASRRRARRVGIKQEIRDAHDQRETLAEENARLRDELAASRSASPAYVDNTVYPDDDAVGRHADSTERHGLFRR
jgi:hypothetical protein